VKTVPTELPCLHGVRILVVDDNSDSAETMGTLLQMCGADVVVRHDGPSATEAAVEFGPHVCVLDVTMPIMDGCELAAWLRHQQGEKPLLLVALTALDGFQAFQREADAGFDLHYTKPADPYEIAEALAEFADQNQLLATVTPSESADQ
jgi:CheY-like chemotaxis protein